MPYPDTPFDAQNSQHIELITEKRLLFTQCLNRLQTLDQSIIRSSLIAGAGLVLRFMPIIGYLSSELMTVGATAYASYHLGARHQALQEYQQSLEELCDIYSWVMEQNKATNLQDKAVQSLIITLAPWTSYKDFLCKWNAEDLAIKETEQSTYKIFQYTSAVVTAVGLGFFTPSADAKKEQPLEAFIEQLAQYQSDTHTSERAYLFYGLGNGKNWLSYTKDFFTSVVRDGINYGINKAPEIYQQLNAMRN